MARVAWLIPLGVAFVIGSCNSVQEAHADCPGPEEQCRPALSGQAFDGMVVDDKLLQGKVVVVNFWATWCGPCRREIPAIEATWKKYREQGLTVVGVVAADPASNEEVEAFLVEHGVSYPVLRDPGDLQRTFKLRHGLPVTFVYDRQGKLVLRQEGEVHEARLDAVVRGLL